MGEVIVVTSGKGGVGKTTATANIGCCLAIYGKNVVVVDADIGLRNLDVVMGLENRIVYDLVDVVEGKCRVKQALIKDKRYPNLYLLAAAQTKDKTAVSPEQMVKLCKSLREEFDYIVIDCPAGIEQGFRNAIAGADRAIVVAVPEVSSVRDADRIVGLLEADEIKSIRLVLNRLRTDMIKRGDMLSIDDVTDVLAIEVLGLIPEDEAIVISSNRG
ncbi:MAG: septum site-determining protein MinD, partial [Defluviitaleaceae bacterium]|nr:septum site-determining protein MinD [Defluviitaleaceae bacterium]